MTIHGVTKPVMADGQLVVKNGNISATSAFHVTIAEYNIEIPSVVRDKIAKDVEIKVIADYQLFKS